MTVQDWDKQVEQWRESIRYLHRQMQKENEERRRRSSSYDSCVIHTPETMSDSCERYTPA